MCNYYNTGLTFNTTNGGTTQGYEWYNFGRNPQICRDACGNVWIRRGQNCGCCHHGCQDGCGCGGGNNTTPNDTNGATGGNGFACITYCGATGTVGTTGTTGTTFGGNDDTGYTVTAGAATYTSDTAGGVLTKQADGGEG